MDDAVAPLVGDYFTIVVVFRREAGFGIVLNRQLLEPELKRRSSRRRLLPDQQEESQGVKAERSEPKGSLDGLAAHVIVLGARRVVRLYLIVNKIAIYTK